MKGCQNKYCEHTGEDFEFTNKLTVESLDTILQDDYKQKIDKDILKVIVQLLNDLDFETTDEICPECGCNDLTCWED